MMIILRMRIFVEVLMITKLPQNRNFNRIVSNKITKIYLAKMLAKNITNKGEC